jgi:hypothetical protein
MTPLPKLTEKEWAILKLFIVREGFALENIKHNPRRRRNGVSPWDLAPEHFYSYPDDIVAHLTTQKYVPSEEKGSYRSRFGDGYVKDIHAVTIPTAGKACRKFVDLGIFERVKEKRTEKKFQETTQYFLKSDFETFKTVLLYLMQHCGARERVEMLSHPYFRKIITEDLVRTILFEKQVSILSRLDIFDFAPDDIPKVLKIFDNKKEGIYADFEEEIQNCIRENEHHSICVAGAASDWGFAPPFFAQYSIPIFPEGMSLKEKLERMKIENSPFDSLDQSIDDAITHFPDVFDDRFKTIEQERLILPILALIQSSPAALAEFVLGTWETFKVSHGIFHKKDEKFSNLLFTRLISLAISDMASTLTIPGNKNVDSFELREISDQLTIDGEYRKEDALLRIGLTCGYDIYYDMGYSTRERKYPLILQIIEEKTPQPKKFWVKVRVRQVSSCFIKKPDIRDIALLLTLLTAKSPISNHIRGKLSNRMQNLLLRYENINAPTSAFTTFLIEEINRTLLREDFYDTQAFSDVQISSETQDAIKGFFHLIEYDDGESTGSNYRVLLHRNRFLLDDAFSDAIARYGDVQYPMS